MTAVARNILTDLVEKRLWPVAVALLVAVVAVPVLLRSTEPAAAPSPIAAPPGAQDANPAAVTLDTTPPARRARAGRLRNPFAAPAGAAHSAGAGRVAGPTTRRSTRAGGAAPTHPAARSTGGSTGASTARGSSGSASAHPTTAPKTPPTAKPKPKATTTAKPKTKAAPATPKAVDATDTYHVSLRFGVDGRKLRTIKDVARLSPLPSETDPFFVFLGVLRTETTHEQRAVFMVSSDAVPTGEGACHPTKQDCETVELTKGQTIFFDYTAPDGTPTQYQLELAGIHKTQIASAAKAQAAIARHSGVGQELLRDAATRNDRTAAGARAYRFIPATGLLVRAERRHVTARAAAAGAIPGLAVVDRKDQPGIPVWHSPKHERAR